MARTETDRVVRLTTGNVRVLRRFVLSGLQGYLKCTSCGVGYLEDGLGRCPQCGAPVVADGEDPANKIRLTLTFLVWDCDTCGAVVPPNRARQCLKCGAQMNEESDYDSNVASRIVAYGLGIERLRERISQMSLLSFNCRGARPDAGLHLKWFSSEIYGPLPRYFSRLDHLFRVSSWDDPDVLETRRAWSEVQALCNDAIDRVVRGMAIVPPVLLLTTHRRTVEWAAHAASVIVEMVSSLVAPSPDEALERFANAQATLDSVGDFATETMRLLDYVKPALFRQVPLVDLIKRPSPDFPQSLPELDPVLSSDPAMLVPVKPFRLLACWGQDGKRRRTRFGDALAVLHFANAHDPDWIGDMATLAELVVGSWHQLVAQHRRICTELDSEGSASRVDEMLDVLSKLAEGPFRRCGSILVIAGKVASGQALRLTEESLFQARRLSTVHDNLNVIAPSITKDVDRLLRNAEAHYDYEVKTDTVSIRHLPPHASSPRDARVHELFHDDIIEQVLNLFEATEATILAVVMFIWSSVREPHREGFRRAWLALQ